MVRIPRSWRAAFHPQGAGRGGSTFAWRPGPRSGMQPMARPPIQMYGAKLTGVPLTGGQAQGRIPASGNLTLAVGPQGLGTLWYPAQATISTTTGPLDTSTALCYLGTAGIPTQLVGTVYTGNGTIALAVPDLQVGDQLIVSWSGAKPGDVAAVNIIGTMDALTTG